MGHEHILNSNPHLNKVKAYYLEAKSYRPEGILGGWCHFGFTPDGYKGKYDLKTAQLNMQRLLGNTLNLPNGSKVLDAGCGYGPVARTLTTEFNLVVQGIDLVGERLSKARQLNKECGVGSIGLAEADYHRLPFPDNYFDGVYTMETLVHAYPLNLVLQEFRRVLKPEGKLVLFEYSIPNLNSLNPIVRNMANRVIERTAMASLHRFTHGAFPHLLEEAGFENVRARDISKNVWQTWHFLWKEALKNTFNQIRDGTFSLDKIQGSAMIYPARSNLGYNVCEASKPRCGN